MPLSAVADIIQLTETVFPGQGTHIFSCPMKCLNRQKYSGSTNGTLKCPHCGMKLFEVKNGEMEHTDHNPKHGGEFFMASDGWHHVECALTPAREFKIFIYDNFTKPMPGAHQAKVEFSKPEIKGNTKSEAMETISGEILTRSLPNDMKLPINVTARVAFANKPNDWVLFTIHYEEFSTEGQGLRSVASLKSGTQALQEEKLGANFKLGESITCLDCQRERADTWDLRSIPLQNIQSGAPRAVTFKALIPYALLPRKLRVAPTGEVFED